MKPSHSAWDARTKERGTRQLAGEFLDALPGLAYGQTDAEGRFRLGPFPVGRYQVKVLREGTWREVGQVQLAEGDVVRAEWTVR